MGLVGWAAVACECLQRGTFPRAAQKVKSEVANASVVELRTLLRNLVDGGGSQRGPALSSMLSSAAKVIDLSPYGRPPFFDSTRGSCPETRLVPESIETALHFGSCPEGLVACFEAIARRCGISALLKEDGCVRALFEVASGNSRATQAPTYHNPWKEARALLAQLAEVQQNSLGQFLSLSPEWHKEYTRLFYGEGDPRFVNFNIKLPELAFHQDMRALYLQGALSDIEWLMVFDNKRLFVHSSDFAVVELTTSRCLVHIMSESYSGGIPFAMKKVRTCTKQKQLWCHFLMKMLEQKCPPPPLHRIAGFLGLWPLLGFDPLTAGQPSPRGEAGGLPTPVVEHPVIDEILHHDLPAVIDPLEAAQFVRIQESDFVVRNLDAGVVEDSADQIWRGTFNRFPHGLREALEHGPALRRCREALEGRGYVWMLEETGAKIFVHPWQYQQVVQHLPPGTSSRDVLVAGSLEFLLEQDLASISVDGSSFRGAWIRTREELSADVDSLPERLGEWPVELQDDITVQRTFLCSSPQLLPAAAVIQSATAESDPSERLNPRRHDVS